MMLAVIKNGRVNISVVVSFSGSSNSTRYASTYSNTINIIPKKLDIAKIFALLKIPY
jgi:hypothetical protein